MTHSDGNSDAIVVGGGVIGLSIAYQLARDGLSVTLLERGEPGREASWAGAGILPPASWYESHPALDELALAAADDQAVWSERLRDETGVDDEYDRCGAEYVKTEQNARYLAEAFERWCELGVRVDRTGSGWLVPTEAQVRNPRRLRALEAACARRGVEIVPNAPAESFVVAAGGRLDAVRTPRGEFSAGVFCLAAGAWTPGVVGELSPDHSLAGRPVRGQMLLLRPNRPTLSRIVHRYPYYAVPRRDGRVLVGATVEDVGFDNQTTDAAFQELLAAAAAIDPSLADATVERHWSGLRPASGDALPIIGPLPGVANAWVASGHHRCGLQLSPPTARMVSAMIRSQPCDLPAAPFDPSRFASAARDRCTAAGGV